MENKKSLIKKFFIFITLVLILFTIYEIIITYAVFETHSEGTVDATIGQWVIDVNGDTITSPQVTTFIVDNAVISQDSNISNGKLAPGLTGYFDLVINPAGTDVSVKYDIFVDISAIENQSITVTSVTNVNATRPLVQTAENIYTGVILLSDIQNDLVDTIRVGISWVNDESNNEQDYSIAVENDFNLAIPITITCTQYLGETIIPYSP